MDNEFHEIRGSWTLGCSGLRGFISRKLNMRKQNTLKRLSVFAHYEAEALEDGLRDGWFVGGMIHDGWVWTIPISKKIISIGIVASSDYYKQAASNPEEFISKQIETVPFFKLAIKPNPRRVETFYLATTNKLFRKLVPSTITTHTNMKFATLTGGDFSKNHFYVHLGYYIGKLCHALYPDSLNKRESTPPL